MNAAGCKANPIVSPTAVVQITRRYLLNAASVKRGDSITTYCHIGQQASLLYFVARYLGYDAHVYDGSFEDWSQRSELPVVKSDGEKSDAKP